MHPRNTDIETEQRRVREWKARALKAEAALASRTQASAPPTAEPLTVDEDRTKPDEHGQSPEAYEDLGRSFFEKYCEIVDDPLMEDFICADSPVEIIDHLFNKIEEAPTASEPVAVPTREDIKEILSDKLYGDYEKSYGFMIKGRDAAADAILALFHRPSAEGRGR